MKVTNDGFVWKLVDGDIAKDIFVLGLFELYLIHYDDSESLIETYVELNNAIENGSEIGIEVGYIGVEQLINITHESKIN